MKKYSIFQRRFALLCLTTIAIWFAPSRAVSDIGVNVSIWHGYDFFYPNLDLTVSNPPPVTYHRVESPNGIIWKNRGSNNDGSDFFVTNNLQAVINECTNGLWTLYLNKNDASEAVYRFAMSISGVTTNVLGDIDILFPVDGSVNVTNQPNILWTITSSFPTVNAHINTDAGNNYFTALPGTATNWMPGILSPGTNTLFLNYFSNNFPGITFTTPTNTSGPLPDWSAQGDLHAYRFSTFNVRSPLPPNPTVGGHTNVAHYNFEDNSIFTADVSGSGNGISGSASFSGCSNNLATTGDAKSGLYAVGFNTSGTNSGGGACVAWLKPPTNLLATLAGSFTVSLWLKPAALPGSGGDSIFSAGGIVSAFGGDIGRSVVPMALAGNRLIFYTGGNGSQDDSLYSDSTLNIGDYVHLVVSRNQATGEKRIYINGVLDASVIASTILLNAHSSLDIGYNNGRGINAAVDDIQIYSGVLAASEVSFLFNNPGTAVANTVGSNRGHTSLARYSFDDGGYLGEDNTGRGNDINCSAGWNTPAHEFNTNAIAGDGAIEFFGVSSLCILPDTQTFTNWSAALGGSFTFSAWVNTTNSKGDEGNDAFSGATIFWAYNDQGNTNDTIPISLTDGKVAFSTRGQTDFETLHSTRRVNDGAYHHIAVTRNRTTGEKKIYVDGQLEASATGTTEPLNGNNYFYSIGGSASQIDESGTNFSSYIGLLDDAQVYSGVLSDLEIATLFNNPGTTIPDVTDVGDPLSEAVDAPYLTWTTGGNADWFAQTNTTFDGVSAAQSGGVGDDQESWIETTVLGPGTLSFRWKVSSEAGADYLTMTMDGNYEFEIDGEIDWEQETLMIPPGVHTLRWSYAKNGNDAEGDDAAWLDQVAYNQSNPLGDAVDAPQYAWSTGGDGSWFSQTETTHDGIDAAQSPGIDIDEQSYIQTTVTGPGRLSFWWKLDSEFCSDVVFLERDGEYITDLFGCHNWIDETILIPPGSHTFRWTYSRSLGLGKPGFKNAPGSGKNVSSAGMAVPNAAWLDEVTFDPNVAPEITFTPGNITAFTGTNLSLSVQLYGNPPPAFSWFKNNVLLPGQTNSTLSINNAQPSDSGSYRLVASNFLGTANSGNIQVVIVDPTDLVPLTLNAPLVVGSQTLVPVTWTVTNTGPGAIETSFIDRLFLTNSTTSAFVVSRTQNPIIPGGTTYSADITNRFPFVAAGDYTLLLNVDFFGSRLETNEANNSLTVPITVINPDIQPGGLQAAAIGIGGQTLQIIYNITNNGPALIDGASWNDRLVLSLDELMDAGDLILSQPALVPTIGVGQRISRTNNVTLPIVPSGGYYLIVRQDVLGSAEHGNLFETNETNNTVAIPIHMTIADLTPVSLSAPAQASTRQPISVQWSIQNIGDATASKRNPFSFDQWTDRLYLSTNQTVNAASIRLGQLSGTFYSPEDFQWLTPLPPGQSMTNSQTVFIPNIAQGNYFLVLSADTFDNVPEINETNNLFAVPIVIANPDLVPIGLTVPATAEAQSTIPVVWNVQNQGNGTAFPNWTDRVYLSTNATYEPQDALLGELQMTQAIGSGSNYLATNFVSIPGVAAGNYFVIVRVDATTNLFESDAANNFIAAPINLASPDLAVARLDAPTNVASQQPIQVTFVVTNLGATTAQPNWADRLYLSTNTTINAGAVPIQAVAGGATRFPVTIALPTGGSYTQEVNVRIPAVVAGDYFLLMQADATNSFAEVNEANNVFAQIIQVENPDLLPTNFLAPDSITITQLNQRVELSWNVLNQGPGAAFPQWSDYVYISPTNILDTNAVFLGNENPAIPVASGQSYLEFHNAALPNGIQGSFYLLMKADNNDQLFEGSELNNVIARPIQIIIPPLPDLSITSVSAPAQAFSGQEVEITWALTNRGNAFVASPFREQIFLATSETGAGAVAYGTFDVTGPLAPGGSAIRKQRITLPLTLSGMRWVIVVTDSSNQIFEFDQESNNSLISAQPINVILSPTPNLVVDSVTAPTNDVFSSQQTSVSWAVTNKGVSTTRSPYWYDTVFLSTDANFGNDTALVNVPNASYLNPGESYVNSATVTLPRGINGTYYFLVRTDAGHQVFENADENDNGTASEPFFVTLTPPPDLRVDSMIVPLNAFSGQPVMLSWIITNSGVGQTLETSWSDRVYLSTNITLDGSDFLLGTFSHNGGLESGGNYRTTNSVTLPVGITGDWYFIVQADAFNHVYEVPFEGNNVSNATTVTTIALTPPPDLETAILLSPTNATSSRLLSVQYRVANNGATITPNSSWSDRLSISTDTNFNPAVDPILTTVRHHGALTPGSAYTNTFHVTLPDTLTGSFYLFVTTDVNQDVFELDRSNNVTFAASRVEIISQPADLAVRLFQAPSAAEAGAGIPVTWAITNLGVGDTAISRWRDRVVLSADDQLGDADDVTLVDLQHDALVAAGAEYSVSNALITIPITTAPGQYRLFVIADHGDAVYEIDKTNNVSAPLPISITRNTADLQIVSVIAPASAISGSSFTAQWVVQNFGNRTPNSSFWTDSVYLSTDGLLSPSDLLLGSRQNVSQLAPGQTYTNSLTVTLPANLDGNYFVIVVVDSGNQVVEAGLDGNNTFIAMPPVAISLSVVPDLSVTAVNAPPVGYSGQRFDLNWTVQNGGGSAADGTWYDAVFLSLDHFLNPFADYYVGFIAHTGPLAPGQSYTNNGSFEIPQGLSGPFFVLVSSDVSGKVFERGNRDNNVAFDPAAMDIQLTPPVDLVAGPITIPANATPGINATITYTVFNFGSNTARGSWEDAIYISADTNFDIGDAFFGRVRHTGDVLPNGSYTNSLTAPLPGIVPGDYHVIVRSDILNNIPESDETNNLGATLNSVAVDVEQLTLGTSDSGTIGQGQSVYYRFDATAGTTVRIRFHTGVALSGSELFVRRGQMPTRGIFDYAVNEPFVSNPDLLIPIEQTGTYYVLAFASAMPAPASYSILAEVIPFSIVDNFPIVAGDRGEATFRIRGALFEQGTKFQLFRDTNVIAAARLALDNSSTAYATFNLVGVTNGPWSLRAFMNETSIVSAILSNAVTVTSGGGPEISFGIDGPLSVWAVFTQRILAFYGNGGNNDAASPLILLQGRDGTAVGSVISQLTTNTLQLLGRSLDGPPDVLRPQSSYSHAAYYRGGGLHVQGRTVPVTDLHPITDADWLDIERSVRPFNTDNATWTAFWSGIRPRVGATWGNYVRFLNRLAEPLPAEQRAVREIFAYYITNQPGFQASSIISGVLLDSTNSAPRTGIEIAFYSATSNGPVALAGSAVTDAGGQFFVPFVPAGEYAASFVDANDLAFDMNRDGREDVVPPTFMVSAGSDLTAQTIYSTQPPPQHPVPNQADAKLALDSQGVLHAFWFRDDQLWHARNSNGNWIEARALNTNKVVAFTVGTSANLIDGHSPGLILVWSQGNYNSVDLVYSVGQSGPDGYFWSQPVRLTDDLVENASPAVIVRDNGLALITYLKRGVRMQDDTDLYFATVNIASGDLLRNDWIMDGPEVAKAGLGNKQTFGWSKELKVKPLGVDLALGLEAAGEFTSQDCDAGASMKLEASALVTSGDYFFKGSVAGEGSFKFNVDPDQCDWVYQPDSSTANLHVSAALGANNIVFRILAAYPPTTAFVNTFEEFINGFAEYVGFKLENSIEFKVTGSLLGAHWPEAPFASFGRPSFNSAEASLGGAIKFAAKNVYGNDIHLLDDGSGNLLTDPDGEPKVNFTLEAGVEIVGKAQIYPSWKAQSLTVTPSLILLTPGGWKIPVPSFLTTPQELIIANDAARPGNQAPTNLFDLTAKMIFVPETAIGTANVYGSNSILANVAADVQNDGAPALARDLSGVPYQIWTREVDPYSGRYGSDLYMSDFDGANWTAPSLIPDTGGINSRVRAATDLLGRRMAIWVHGATTVTTNTSLGEFFAARRAVEIHYVTYNGTAWSAPQPVVLTAGPDADLQVSTLANGNILAVWTYTDSNALVHLVSSRWDGSTWSALEEIASGELRTPAAQQIAGITYLLWTQTDRADDQPELSLYQSVNSGSGWSAPAAFVPQLAAPPEPLKQAPGEIVLARTIGGILFGEIPEKCCQCKGKVTAVTNGTPTDCGVSFSKYDYEKCQKIFEYKACPRQSFDPNDIVGPEGFGPERFVGVTSPLNYIIHFENDPLLANAPAKEVVITLPLDSDFDPRTFRLGNFGFGDISVTVPPGRAFYSTRLDLTATRGFYLDFFAGVDVAKHEAFWRLTTIDPATGGLPINPLVGFLPVNSNSPEGEGFVAFSLLPGATTAQGARVDATATIIFDTQPPIDTPSIFNTIETGIPTSAVAALPAITNEPNFVISWAGSDGLGGSGIASYDIYFSQDGGSYAPLFENTTLTEAPFAGEFDTSYAFYSIARDNAGNVEAAPSTPDAVIFVASPNTAPVLLNLTNATIVEKVLFTRQIEATDADVPTNLLTFALLSGPTGMSLHPTTGLLSWTPTEAQGPTNTTVVIKVTDNGFPVLSATNSFSITVLETNEPPVFVGPNTFTVDELVNLRFTNVVMDADIPTNQITLQLESAPEGVTFDPLTGIVDWTPTEAQGPSTNQIVVQAKDDGIPALKTLRTNTVVVREVNSAPVLDAITNRTVLPLSIVLIDLHAEDSDIPTNTLTFSLGAAVSVPAIVNPQTGALRWRTTLSDAGTSNLISVVVTDNGTPSMSATQNFAIVVEDYAGIALGSATLLVNETSSVPIRSIASAPWQTLNFTLQLPEGTLDQLALSNATPFTAGSLVALDATRSLLTFSNAPGHTLQGTQQLAQLTFRAPGPKSAFVPLVPENISATRTNGNFFNATVQEPGRVVVVGLQPLLDALRPVANQHFLTLFGNPGMTYQLDTTTNLNDPVQWQFFSEITLTNVSQRVEGVINPPPDLFYRVRQ